MDSAAITEVARATQAGTMPFPEAVGRMMETGVESYRVDYATLSQTFYGAHGDVVVAAIPYEGLPSVAANLDVAALRAAIVDSQRNGQKFRDFSRRAMAAGVQGYTAFLRGKRVTYWGRDGEQHTEWFPGAGPEVLPPRT